MKIIDIHNHYVIKFDPECEMLMKFMDLNEIETMLLMGVSALSQHANNDQVLEMVRRHPDRFVGGAYVDPRAEDARDAVRKYRDQGFRCIKMFPYMGFYPDEPEFFPVYEVIAELDLLLLYHCGGSTRTGTKKNVSYKYDLPCQFDGVAHNFPEIRIVLAHMGGSLRLDEALYLAHNHKNLYLDTSCTSATRALRVILKNENNYPTPLNCNKLVWGRDGISPAETERKSGVIREQYELLSQLAGGDRQVLENIFYNNAKRLLAIR